jgi:hypothetical protein
MKLRHHIALLLVVKLMALTALWFAFVHGHRLKPDADAVHEHLTGISGISPSTSTRSVPHV